MKLILLSATTFPLPFHLEYLCPLIFFVFVPLFRGIEKHSSLKKQMLAGFIWGSVSTTGLCYWLFYALTVHYEKNIFIAFLFILIAVLIPMGILYSLFAVIYSVLKSEKLFFYLLVVPSLWILFDLLKEILFFLVPWALPGYAAVPFSSFIQIADIFGVHGVTFIIVMINSLFVYIFNSLKPAPVTIPGKKNLISQYYKFFMEQKVPLILIISLILIPVLYGFNKISQIKRDWVENSGDNLKLNTVVVQGNFNHKNRWNGESFFPRIQTYVSMTGKQTQDSKLIVWPETVLNSPGKTDDSLFKYLINKSGRESILITGGLRKTGNKLFNSAYIICGSGIVKWYDKSKLLPYAETTPFGNLLGSYYSAPSSFTMGNSSSAVKTDKGTFGISICFEALYPDLVRKSVLDGADLLVNISNDAWFGKTSQPNLHLNSARMRAIENRRYLIRASNSGISAVVSPDGKILAKSGIFTRESIHASAVKIKKLSKYTVYGYFLPLFPAIILISCLTIFIFSYRE